MKHCREEHAARSAMTGRQVLLAQAVLVGGLMLALLVKEIPGIVRELRIYRMTGGLRAGNRYP
ncbi:hypothetical protein ACGFYV_06250 [Streptomyces sp. NPDC048297]|uniref:hypothetical protein n=1 Tax=Streptomyces sp. NPDC048297 TaxID=3365531 RepID=UPI00371E36C2